MSGNLNVQNHQLAFGASDIVSDISSAVDNAFDQIIEIKSNLTDEINLIDSNILDSSFDPQTTSFLKQILLPKKPSTPTPDTSFGVFIGYSISLDGTNSLSNNAFISFIRNRMQSDILSVIPHIQNKIISLNLNQHSFYFYVLPLINAENDKDTIMNTSLEVN